MMKQLMIILSVIVVLFGLVIWETYSWKECRKDHPIWYCVRILGK
jgi:hypothetical protein